MHATIIGAGIAGLALAKGLRSIGFEVEIYEQAPELKPVGAGIMLTTNGLRALQALGLYDGVLARAWEVSRLSVLDRHGNPLETTDHLELSRRFGHVSAIAMHRADLHEELRSGLPPGALHTGKRCTAVRELRDKVEVQFADGQTLLTDLLFACDGIHSVVRTSFYPDWRERFADYTCWRGIAGHRPDGVEPGHVSESWGRGKRFGIVPLTDGQVYWFACLGADAPNDPQFAQLKLPQLRSIFSEFHASVREVLNATTEDTVVWTDIFDVPPKHHYTRQCCILVGDAAHAVTPDLGQGACQALEDAAVLSALLARYSLAEAFTRFDAERVPRTQRLVRYSRRFARLAQVTNPIAIQLRNAVVRNMPKAISERWIDSILDVQFEPLPTHLRSRAATGRSGA